MHPPRGRTRGVPRSVPDGRSLLGGTMGPGVTGETGLAGWGPICVGASSDALLLVPFGGLALICTELVCAEISRRWVPGGFLLQGLGTRVPVN